MHGSLFLYQIGMVLYRLFDSLWLNTDVTLRGGALLCAQYSIPAAAGIAGLPAGRRGAQVRERLSGHRL